jgi:predicted nucleic acid-binding Zn ribbon protein
VLGEYAERRQRRDRLLLFGIGAAIGVLLILMASFGNVGWECSAS